MARVLDLCAFLLWMLSIVVNTEFYVQHPAGLLLCSETRYEAGAVRSVQYDVQQFSCLLNNTRSLSPLTRYGSGNFYFRKVSMCVPVCGESGCQGLTRSSVVAWCQETRRHEAGDETDRNQSCQLTTEPKRFSEVDSVDVNLTKMLHSASELGNLCLVRYILSHRLADIDCRGEHGRTPLLSAAWKGQAEVFDFLVKEGCDLSVVNNFNNNPLHLACISGNTDLVGKLVDNKMYDMEGRGSYDRTPLMMAAAYGHIKVFDLLAGKGCNLTAMAQSKFSILHIACAAGRVDMVDDILSLDVVSINSRSTHGLTPMLIAAKHGHKGVVQLLVRKGCNVREVDDNKNNILHTASFRGHVEMVRYILSTKMADIESECDLGRTPVMKAVWYGHIRLVKLFERKGCNLQHTDKYGYNILHLASLRGHADMVKYILSNSVIGLESKTCDGHTALMKAVRCGHKEVVDLLLMHGSTTTVQDNVRNNILHLACISGRIKMVEYIMSLGIIRIESKGTHGRTPVMLAAGFGHVELVKLLVRKGCNLKAVDNDKETILHLACLNGSVSLVKLILSTGVLGIDTRGGKQRTPAMKAAEKGHVEILKVLVRRGCNLEAVERDGDNIIHVASWYGRKNVLKYLVSLDIAGWKAKNKYGLTPRDFAVFSGHAELASFFIS